MPGKGEQKQDCAASRVRMAFPHAVGPLVVHRLDMDTSGLLVLALDEDAQRRLSAQFERRTVTKAYVALVHGVPGAESGVIDVPLRADIERRPIQIVDPVQGREAITRWNVVALEPDRTRLRLVPETGRTHQLRVHCAHIGHPIIGDVLYAPLAAPMFAGERLMLHATELGLDDPTDGSRVQVMSPPPF